MSTKPWLLLVWGYGLVGLVPLIWRAEAPVAVFGVQWVLAVIAWPILPYYTPVAGLMVAVYAVAVHRDRRVSLPALLVSLVSCGIDSTIPVLEHRDFTAGLRSAFHIIVFFAFTAGGVWALGRVARASHQHVQKVESERDEAKEAVIEQRKQLARELHDIIAHAVTVMVVQAGGAARLPATEFRQVTESLAHIETAGRQAMAELRRLLGVLGGAGSDDLEPQPGLADLDALLGSLRALGMPVTVHTDGAPRNLDPSVDLAAYRIVQEALTNILKHAGADTNPRLQLTWQAHRLRIQVDNATKTPPERSLPGGYGLLGLRERARAVGGHLHAGPHQNGYRLIATLPLTDTAQPALLDHQSEYLHPPAPDRANTPVIR